MRQRGGARSAAVTALRAFLALTLLALALAAGMLWHLNYNDGVDISRATASRDDATTRIERGAYLARTGNCLACHTARGGAPGAGGLALATPYGTLYTSNLTPDPGTGIGAWSAAAFWRALHHGRSADGRLLYPAFPYTHTTLLTRADADALFSYFRSLPAVHQEVPRHELRWPYGTQLALAVWRALYFQPGEFRPDPAQGAEWNRGAYLVRAVAHCSACHASRDRLGGADWDRLDGGLMEPLGWYAPSLLAADEAGLAAWPIEEIVRLLQTGISAHGSVSGPMAEVVLRGSQHFSDTDLRAIAGYLKALPQQAPAAATAAAAAPPETTARRLLAGQQLYQDHCASCHGERGEGRADAYPPLAGNRMVTLARTENLLQMVLYGGFGPATAGHPRPHGMPPFTQLLSDAEIAAVLSYVRSSWGNQAPEISPSAVHTMRTAAAQALPR